jgi:hypothetical protein
MKSLEKINICLGVSVENYKSPLPENIISPVFKTIDGEPGAFVETMPKNSCVYEKCVRSTKCSFLIQDGTCCKYRLQAEHYLWTLKSRSQKSNQNNHSKHTRFDYMSKENVIQNSREMAAKVHRMQVKLKRLEQYQQEMSTVGDCTDSNFRTLFNSYMKDLAKLLRSKIIIFVTERIVCIY